MLKGIIDFSLRYKFVVVLGTIALILGGGFAVRNIPPGRHSRLVRRPSHRLHGVARPGAPDRPRPGHLSDHDKDAFGAQGESGFGGIRFYGFSFVYVIFEDGTDPYWARSRVLEYLSGLGGGLPQGP